MRSEFENSIKWSSSYEKLVYQHGERLFIFDDGKYKIAAVQLAWEIFKEKQTEVDELNQQLESEREETIKGYTKISALRLESDELQKRVDAAIYLLPSIKAENDLWGCDQVERQIELLEQALKGGSK